MTIKDYLAIAAIIRAARDKQDLIINLGVLFAQDNSEFDVKRWVEASNQPSKVGQGREAITEVRA